MERKPSICFLAPAAWPVLSGDRSIKTVGGAEVQICFLARALARSGYQVTMICMDYGQPEGIEIDGVRVFKAHTPSGGIPVLRFVHPRFTSIWRAMQRADADIYYQRASGVHTGYAAAFCRWHGKKFIFAAASDLDFDPAFPLIGFSRDKRIYAWGLKRADAIVVQNPHQRKLCEANIGMGSQLVRSCYAPPPGATRDSGGYVLWVSTMRKLKRPEIFIDLARRLPQHRFRMVGGADGGDYFASLRRLAESVPNLEFVGFVPHADIEREFNGARIFVNTSEHEGFPNTFLQAWGRSVPCVSYVDTGSTANGRPVVNRVQDLNEMADVVSLLMSDNSVWHEAGQRSYTCFKEQHSVEATQMAYQKIINELRTRANKE